jgi:hypothetical protein
VALVADGPDVAADDARIGWVAPIVQRDGCVVADEAADCDEDGVVDVQPRQFDRFTAPRSGEVKEEGRIFVVREPV